MTSTYFAGRLRARLALLAVSVFTGAHFGVAQSGTPDSSLDTTVPQTWVGNSFSGQNRVYVEQSMLGIFVTPSGTIYTSGGFDEAGQQGDIFDNNGNLIGNCTDQFGTTAIVADSLHCYSADDDEIHEYTLNSNGSEVDYNSFFESQNWPSPTPKGISVRGLALNGGTLYVADATNNAIYVYDTVTNPNGPSLSNTFNLNFVPGKLAVDSAGKLWVQEISSGTLGSTVEGLAIHCFTPDGTEQTDKLLSGNGLVPTGLSYDGYNSHDRLLVANGGTAQQVVAYTNLGQGNGSPTIDASFANNGTFGASGGIYDGASPGLVYDPNDGGYARFNGITDVGVDSSENLYVSSTGTYGRTPNDAASQFYDPLNDSELRAFGPGGNFLWLRIGQGWNQGGAIDPGTESNGVVDVFTSREHYSLDLSQQPGQDSTYIGYTVGRFGAAYQQDISRATDPSGGNDTFVTRLGGQRFLVHGGEEFYRFQGEVALPAGGIFRTSQFDPRLNIFSNYERVFWYDSNGDGVIQPGELTDLGQADQSSGGMIDGNGNFWNGGFNPASGGQIIHEFLFQNVDNNGVPVYNSKSVDSAAPAPFNGNNSSVNQVYYDSSQDTLYIAGSTAAYPTQDSGFPITVIGRFPQWSQGNPQLDTGFGNNGLIVLPYDTTPFDQGTIKTDDFDLAGGYIFCLTGDPKTLVYDKNTGQQTTILAPGSSVGATYPTPFNPGVGTTDNGTRIHAYQRTNGSGEYLITVESEEFQRVLVYRWTPGVN